MLEALSACYTLQQKAVLVLLMLLLEADSVQIEADNVCISRNGDLLWVQSVYTTTLGQGLVLNAECCKVGKAVKTGPVQIA